MLKPLHISRISPPTFEEFHQKYVNTNTPVVITGMVENWPALKLWNLDYFKKKFGTAKVGAVRLINGQYDVDENRGAPTENIPFGQVVDSVANQELNGLVLAAQISAFPDSIQKDFTVPVYAQKGSYPITRVFLSPEDALTPLHQDYPENIYVMVKGTKRITLFEPGAPVYANRFSKLPTYSLINPEQPDYVRFPKLKNAQPYTVDLTAGETLFIPSFWWHHLRNLEPTISMHFWWSRSWMVALAWLAVYYNKWFNKK